MVIAFIMFCDMYIGCVQTSELYLQAPSELKK